MKFDNFLGYIFIITSVLILLIYNTTEALHLSLIGLLAGLHFFTQDDIDSIKNQLNKTGGKNGIK